MTRSRTTSTNTPALSCPCEGAGIAPSRAYAVCCGRWHAGEQRLGAPTAEALMRSRYSAFVLDLLDYLQDTWHPDTRPRDLQPNPVGLKWLGLQIKRHHSIDAGHAEVEFVARSRFEGRASRLHELSRFERVDGVWLYRDGDIRE